MRMAFVAIVAVMSVAACAPATRPVLNRSRKASEAL